jgi:hypothetical protein
MATFARWIRIAMLATILAGMIMGAERATGVDRSKGGGAKVVRHGVCLRVSVSLLRV